MAPAIKTAATKNTTQAAAEAKAKTSRAVSTGVGLPRVEVTTLAKLAAQVAESGVFFGERLYEARASRATHTHGPLTGIKTEFTLALHRGKLHLLDGYTRLANYAAGLIPKNPDVLLKIYDCKLRRDLTNLYDQLDSRHAAKTRKDAFYEGLRTTGVDGRQLESGMLRYGPVTTAVACAYGVDSSQTRYATIQLSDAIMALDALHLVSRRERVSAGVLAGMLLVMHQCTGDKLGFAQHFFEGVHAVTFGKNELKAGRYVVDFREFHDERRDALAVRGVTSCEKVRDEFLSVYVAYCEANRFPRKGPLPKVRPLNPAEFGEWARQK